MRIKDVKLKGVLDRYTFFSHYKVYNTNQLFIKYKYRSHDYIKENLINCLTYGGVWCLPKDMVTEEMFNNLMQFEKNHYDMFKIIFERWKEGCVKVSVIKEINKI